MRKRTRNAQPHARPVPPPHLARQRLLSALVVLAGVPMVLLWVAHGDLEQLGSPTGLPRAVGHITGLLGTYLALIQLVLMSRSPWLERTFGMDRMAAIHRRLGFATLWFLVVHAAVATVRLAIEHGVSVPSQAWLMLTSYPFLPMAFASLALLVLVAVASVRRVRRRLSYETWLGIHLYAYLAIALGFGHQLLAADFAGDRLATAYWILLYVVTVALVAAFRIGQPIVASIRHGLRVVNVVGEGPGVVSIYMTGRDIGRLNAVAGQYFQWRFLTSHGWWRTHPFSLSAAPNGQWLRITVKALGSDSKGMAELPIGTRVMFEGPYGVMTLERRTRKRVLLVAAGIGITPIRALFEGLTGDPGDVTLIYRASSAEDVLLRPELESIATVRGHHIHYVVGARGVPPVPSDPLGPAEILRLVPDVRHRDAYLCGPVSMMQAVEDALRHLGIPATRLHAERFAF